MAFRWVCKTCGNLHGTNPSQCRNCGASILSPVSRKRVSRHSSQPAEVESLDPDGIITYGTTPTPDYPSSPDVAVDGSVKDESNEPVDTDGTDSALIAPWQVALGLSILFMYGLVAVLVL